MRDEQARPGETAGPESPVGAGQSTFTLYHQPPAPSTTLNSTFAVARFRNKTSTRLLQQECLEFPALAELLTTHTERAEKDGAGWSPTLYRTGATRANSGVIELSCLVFDYDGAGSMGDLLPRWKPLRFILHTTHSHTAEAPHFRAIFPLAAPVPACDWPQTWEKLFCHLGEGEPDKDCKDPSRFWYLPSHPPGAEHFFTVNDGALLDPATIPDYGPAPPASTGSGNGYHPGNGRVSPDVLIRRALERAPAGRNNAGFWLAAQARDNRYSEVETEHMMADYAGRVPETNTRGEPEPYTEREWRATLEQAFRTPPREPWGTTPEPVRITVGGKTAPAAPPATGRQTLPEVLEMFQRWMYLPDTGAVEITLATVAANLLPGDPTWLLLVGPPGAGKTEVLQSISGIEHVKTAATITEAALLSGTSKKERAQDSRGGLLREIGDFGILLCKDFGSILSMPRDSRACLLAALREIYDGSWSRHVGIDGGRTLAWAGKLGLLAGCTPAIDSHHAVMSSMGERFVLYRLTVTDQEQQARRAIGHAGQEARMRKELCEAVSGLFAGFQREQAAPSVSEPDQARLIQLASFAARCRSSVERDGRDREIELIPEPEGPARLALALTRLRVGMSVIGVPDERAWQLLSRIALDCMPALRLRVLRQLARTEGPQDTRAIALAVSYPTTTARRALEDLCAHHVLLRETSGNGKADCWQLSQWTRDRIGHAGITVPEMSGDIETRGNG